MLWIRRIDTFLAPFLVGRSNRLGPGKAVPPVLLGAGSAGLAAVVLLLLLLVVVEGEGPVVVEVARQK